MVAAGLVKKGYSSLISTATVIACIGPCSNAQAFLLETLFLEPKSALGIPRLRWLDPSAHKTLLQVVPLVLP